MFGKKRKKEDLSAMQCVYAGPEYFENLNRVNVNNNNSEEVLKSKNKFCKECGHLINEGEEECPECGAKVEEDV